MTQFIETLLYLTKMRISHLCLLTFTYCAGMGYSKSSYPLTMLINAYQVSIKYCAIFLRLLLLSITIRHPGMPANPA